MKNKVPVPKVNGVEVGGDWKDEEWGPWVNSIDWDVNNLCTDCEGAGEWQEVNAMGKGFASSQCSRCKGYGHYAKECGTPYGALERGTSVGKGFYFGFGSPGYGGKSKGGGKAPKGCGKGFDKGGGKGGPKGYGRQPFKCQGKGFQPMQDTSRM